MPASPAPRPADRIDPDVPARPVHRDPAAVLLVFLGGATGTALRYLLARQWPTTTGGWPTGTFVANAAGALVLGALLEVLARSGPDDGWRRRLRILAGTGFCGGLTTYSTLAVETDLLTRAGDGGLALGYLLASVATGLVAVTVGALLAASVHSRRDAR